VCCLYNFHLIRSVMRASGEEIDFLSSFEYVSNLVQGCPEVRLGFWRLTSRSMYQSPFQKANCWSLWSPISVQVLWPELHMLFCFVACMLHDPPSPGSWYDLTVPATAGPYLPEDIACSAVCFLLHDGTIPNGISTCFYRPAKDEVKSVYSYAPHNDVSVNDGPHIRRLSHKIIIS
jgi:hypothetical protein